MHAGHPDVTAGHTIHRFGLRETEVGSRKAGVFVAGIGHELGFARQGQGGVESFQRHFVVLHEQGHLPEVTEVAFDSVEILQLPVQVERRAEIPFGLEVFTHGSIDTPDVTDGQCLASGCVQVLIDFLRFEVILQCFLVIGLREVVIADIDQAVGLPVLITALFEIP